MCAAKHGLFEVPMYAFSYVKLWTIQNCMIERLSCNPTLGINGSNLQRCPKEGALRSFIDYEFFSYRT